MTAYRQMDDLKLITDVALLQGTAYFEFATAESDGKALHWNQGSLFISDCGFVYLSDVFARTHPHYDFYSFMRFDQIQLAALITELEQFIDKVNGSKSLAQLEACFSPHIAAHTIRHGPDFSLQVHAISQASTGIVAFARQALTQYQFMWVLGI